MADDPGRRPFRLELGSRHVTRDVDAEIEFHLAMRTRALVASGLDPAEARARALEQFGDSSTVRTECVAIDTRRARAVTYAERLDNLQQDAAYAVRTLRQRPGFTAVVVLILGLGIGANTATFRVIDALMFRALPVPHPEQLVTVSDPRRTGSFSVGTPRADLVSYPLYLDMRDGNHVFSGLYASGRADRLDVVIDRQPPGTTAGGTAGRTAGGTAGRVAEAEHPRGRYVSGNYFSVLGVGAAAGRTFSGTEDRLAGADPVAVISYDYWQRHLAGDPAVVGRTMTVDGARLVIIGVAARGFTGDIVGQPTDLWLPVTMQSTIVPGEPLLSDRGLSWLLLMGRLAPGVSLAQARSAMTVLLERSMRDHAPGTQAGDVERSLREKPPQVGPGARGFSYYRSVYASALVTLTAAVGLVLLVVCANVANLMLARAAARGREIGVRIALGAGRLRLVQQLLTESTVLAAAGGAAGLLVAWWGSTALLRLTAGAPNALPLDVRFDGRILAYTVVISLTTALLFGLVPAIRATRTDLAAALRTQTRGLGATTGKPGRLPLGKGLVVAQVALSMLLLVGTGMLVRSTQRLQSADVGLARDHLLVVAVNAQRSGYAGPRLAALMRDLLTRARAVPGVAAVSLSENGIFSGTESGTTLQVEGYSARVDSDTVVAYDDVGPGYFHAIGAHLLRGRDIEARDDETAPKVAVLNATMARFFFPHGDALGHHVTADSSTWEIVGIVADVQANSVRDPAPRRIYVPTMQWRVLPGQFNLEVRTTGDPARLATAVRRALVGADASLAIFDAEPLTQMIRDSIGEDRLLARAVSFFGGLALIVSALGLYGVMAYATARRTSEFGLRMALGAGSGTVTRMVLGEAMQLAGIGMLIGLPVALGASQLMRGQLFHIGVLDPPSIGIAVVVLSVSAAVAAYLPALRAASVAPLEAIRAD